MGPNLRPGLETSEETSRLIRRWRWRRLIIFVLVVGGLGFGLGGWTTWLRDGLGWPLTINEPLQKADVIIVLGAGTRKQGDPLPPQAKQRVLEGIKLYQASWAPEILMSGGRDRNTGLTESKEMVLYAYAQGISPAVMIAETESKDTVGNAKYSLAIMNNHQWRTAIVVTSPYHTWRTCLIFRHQGGDVRCESAPYDLLPQHSVYERLTDTRSVVREYGAIVYNWIRGQL